MRKVNCYIAMMVAALVLCVGCKPSLPKGILSSGDMKDILYDYHLAQSMANRQPDKAVCQRIYLDAVLRKHNITKEEFDASLAYYMRHTLELKKIYAQLDDRFTDEARIQGMSTSDISAYGVLSQSGDTANIWKEASSMVLMPQVPFNQRSYRVEADTAFRAGDKIILNFDCNFIYQDGRRGSCAMLAIKFKNDSVTSTTCQMSSATHYSLTLTDRGRIGIKEIKGYFVLPKNQSEMESQSTLQLMFIHNIQLIRMRQNESEAHPLAPASATLTDEKGLVAPKTAVEHMERPLPPPRNGGALKAIPLEAKEQRVIN